MPKFSVDHLGQIGIIRDLAKYRLQPNTWSEGSNVVFDNDKVRRMYGSTPIWAALGMAPWHVLFQRTVNEMFWIASGQTRIKVWNGLSWTDLSRGALYNAAYGIGWNGGIFGGIAILNNSIDPPQYWAMPDTASNFEDLPNWPANTLARVMRPFGPFLVAGNITKSGVVHEHMIKWSDRADPGTVPGSWDETDATVDAGETNLVDTSAGPILDLGQIGDSLFIYKSGSVHEMTRTRDAFIFDFKHRFNSGILTTNCVTPVPRQRLNFLMTGDDLVVHNAQQMNSIVDRRWRRWLVNEMAFESAFISFTVVNAFHNECWFCFPEVGENWCTKALVWNYVENTLGVRELDNISFGTSGIVLTDSDPWDAAIGDWDSDSQAWNTLSYDPRKVSILLADPLNERVLHGVLGNQIAGVDMNASVERKALAIVGRDLQGNYIAEQSTIKVAQRIWVRGSGAPFNVRLGAHDEESGDVVWDQAQLFDPTIDQYVDPVTPPNGRFLAVQFSSDTGDPWEIEGYTLELETLGEF